MKLKLPLLGISLFPILLLIGLGIWTYVLFTNLEKSKAASTESYSTRISLESHLASVSAELETLKNEDQRKKNNELQEEIKNIQTTYDKAVDVYDSLVKLRELTTKTAKLDESFVKALTTLSKQDYASASATLVQLEKDIKGEQDTLAAAAQPTIPANVPVNNAPPGSGYSRQQVVTDVGSFMVSLIAGDLGSTRVIVDTASDGSCNNECPVLALGDYVARTGAFAGINGSYFCPASYPQCAGRTNSFDTLLMNKNKVYFNSDNNVFSTVPVVIFGGGWVRFEGQSLNWGRDTGVDGVLANQPLLVAGGNVVFGGDGDPKKGSRGNRSFVSNKGNTVYIGVVHSATVAEAAHALKGLGMDNGLNLDSGGSTALWSGGYKVGPGRAIPNAILFVRK